MLVDIGQDPLYEVVESPVKTLKDRLKREKKNSTVALDETTVEIFDPLPLELTNYKSEITYKKPAESSKASQSLKKYIIQQEKNLRCVRLERISPRAQKNKQLSMKIEENNNKVIHIPQIEDMFKNQARQILVHENTTLRERITKIITKLDDNITRFRSLSYQHSRDAESKIGMSVTNNYQNEDQIDEIIAKKLQKSHDLQTRFYKDMEEKNKQVAKATKGVDTSFLQKKIEIPKTQQLMKGIRFYPYKDGDKKLHLTSACILLFEMHKLGEDQQRKETQLTGLLKNSFQNRESILEEKTAFYENEDIDLSIPSQFRLRKLMNQKLNRRLEISKQQVNKFILFLQQVKNYFIVLNPTLLSIFQQVRSVLLSGKVMKTSDLTHIIDTKNQEDLKMHPNAAILAKLHEMMI